MHSPAELRELATFLQTEAKARRAMDDGIHELLDEAADALLRSLAEKGAGTETITLTESSTITTGDQGPHTPLPWKARGKQVLDTSYHMMTVGWCTELYGAGLAKNGEVESFSIDEDTAHGNAALIVRAVNAYDALVGFARYVADMDPGNPAPLFANARAALTKAQQRIEGSPAGHPSGHCPISSLPSTTERATDEQAVWLIEWPEDDNVPVRWWHPVHGWVRDANKAMWLGRKSDAAGYISANVFCSNVKATQHIFMSASQEAPREPSTKSAPPPIGSLPSGESGPSVTMPAGGAGTDHTEALVKALREITIYQIEGGTSLHLRVGGVHVCSVTQTSPQAVALLKLNAALSAHRGKV